MLRRFAEPLKAPPTTTSVTVLAFEMIVSRGLRPRSPRGMFKDYSTKVSTIQEHRANCLIPISVIGASYWGHAPFLCKLGPSQYHRAVFLTEYTPLCSSSDYTNAYCLNHAIVASRFPFNTIIPLVL